MNTLKLTAISAIVGFAVMAGMKAADWLIKSPIPTVTVCYQLPDKTTCSEVKK